MKLSSQVKLVLDAPKSDALVRTIRAANDACNYASMVAWQKRTFRQFPLHRLVYKDIRSRFGVSAQVAVRVIAKVADAYKLDKERKRTFKPLGSVAYDDRILSWNVQQKTVSIWTLAGRKTVPFVCGEGQYALLLNRKGETDLSVRRGKFYLSAACDVAEPEASKSTDAIGVDMGIKNIAVDSDGTVYSSAKLNGVRHRHRRLRTKLQKKRTKSAKRKLKRLSGKESRFAADTNHCISKKLVAKAKDTKRMVAVEDLTGIHMRITVSRRQRATLTSWSFAQLRFFLTYKAMRNGVRLVSIDPRNTSRTCPSCGTIDKKNRKSQRLFSCVSCGFAGLADHIAAENIRRAAVNQPNVARVDAKAARLTAEPRRSAVTSTVL